MDETEKLQMTAEPIEEAPGEATGAPEAAPPGPACFMDRELSWLQFNLRVLREAGDPTVPLLERLKFLSI